MQRVPYEGVSRCSISPQSKDFVRRGLALIIESDFYATDAGRHTSRIVNATPNPTTSPFTHVALLRAQSSSIRYCVRR